MEIDRCSSSTAWVWPLRAELNCIELVLTLSRTIVPSVGIEQQATTDNARRPGGNIDLLDATVLRLDGYTMGKSNRTAVNRANHH
jgi:hypothetical protein